MEKINFNLNIHATAAKVWQVLWQDATYRQWTSVFQEGAYAVSDWKEGSKIQFLAPNGSGMYGVIAACRPHEYMAFRHMGEIKNFEEQPIDEKTKQWQEGLESYSLKEENGTTNLDVNLDAPPEFVEYFSNVFPKALTNLKEIAEKPLLITVEANVEAPIEKVWDCWTMPEHIAKWNFASDDWHCPKATNDLKPGGQFSYTMAAKDGSFEFDFAGKYNDLKNNELIDITLGDSRSLNVQFTADGNHTRVVESFEAETENPLEMQQGGWQMILNNFKKYTETN